MGASTARSTSDADLRSFLAARVAERVEHALADAGTCAQLAAAGVSLADARSYLQARTYRVLAAEAGL